MYYLKFKHLFIQKMTEYVRLDNMPTYGFDELKNAEEAARKIAAFMGSDIEVILIQSVSVLEP